MRNLDGTELKRLHRGWRRRTTQRIELILDSVQTPYNIGSIVRTAAALGVEHLHLLGATESPAHSKANKTSMGTQRYLAWSSYDTAGEALEDVRSRGLRVVGVELADGSEPLFGLDLAGDVVLAVGHEDRGLSKELMAGCDAVGYLPQTGKVGSLNVAVACSIAVYEARRQAWAAATGPV